jgi:CHASE2 domain-containing sensor protein
LFRRFRAGLAGIAASYRSTAKVSIWLPAAVVLTFAVLEAFNPFGINAAAGARSEQATLRIVSPYYTPSREVAVVLVDDDYLRARKVGWPLRFAEQGRLLRQIASAGPAVILVDFVYPHRHGDEQAGTGTDDIESLLNPIVNTENPVIGGVPIVFTAMAKGLEQLPPDFSFCAGELRSAQAPLDILDRESLPEALQSRLAPDGAGRFRVGYVRWSRCGNDYPLLLGGDVRAPTPVFAAYQAFCDSAANSGRCTTAHPSRDPAAYVHPMIVRAGAFPPPEQKFAYSESACQRPMPERREIPRNERFLAALQQLTLGVFRDLRTARDPQLALPCPAVAVIPMSRLQDASRVEWEALLQNKAVVLGADISGIPDFIDSPVHGQIPGAVWHGMALDNLVSLGDRYLSERHPKLKEYGGFALLLLFAYAFPYILYVLEMKSMKVGRAWVSLTLWLMLSLMYWGFGDGTAAITCLAIGVGLDLTSPSTSVVYLLGIALAAVLSALLLEPGIPPGNWLGLVLVAAAFGHTMKAYCRGTKRKPFPAELSVLRAIYVALTALRNRRTARLPEPPATGE